MMNGNAPATARSVAPLAGIDLTREVASGLLDATPLLHHLGIHPVSVSETGEVVFEMQPTADALGPYRAVLGGAQTTLCDIAGAVSAVVAWRHRFQNRTRSYFTRNMSMQFLRPASDGPLCATAVPTYVSDRRAIATVHVENDTGSLVTTGVFEFGRSVLDTSSDRSANSGG
jgi:uncharacterized protein (TIGR00369 family)